MHFSSLKLNNAVRLSDLFIAIARNGQANQMSVKWTNGEDVDTSNHLTYADDGTRIHIKHPKIGNAVIEKKSNSWYVKEIHTK